MLQQEAIQQVIDWLPQEVQDMSAEEFLAQCSMDAEFKAAYDFDVDLSGKENLLAQLQTEEKQSRQTEEKEIQAIKQMTDFQAQSVPSLNEMSVQAFASKVKHDQEEVQQA